MNEGKEYSVWSAGAIGAFNDKHRNKKVESIVDRVQKMERALSLVADFCKNTHEHSPLHRPCDCLECRTKRIVIGIIDDQLTPSP